MTEQGIRLWTVDELVGLARSGELDAYCVYGPDGNVEADGRYLLADFPIVVDDQEVYPLEVTARRLWLLYAGDQFTDVVHVADNQVQNPSLQQIVDALRYYHEHDTFLDL